jgi:phosphoribosylanthranilate isomerase
MNINNITPRTFLHNIELIEDFSCNTREELNKKEGHYIQTLPHVVNKNVSGRDPKESYKACIEKYKDHYIQYHKDYNKKYFKNYYETHKEYFKNYNKNRKASPVN